RIHRLAEVDDQEGVVPAAAHQEELIRAPDRRRQQQRERTGAQALRPSWPTHGRFLLRVGSVRRSRLVTLPALQQWHPTPGQGSPRISATRILETRQDRNPWPHPGLV